MCSSVVVPFWLRVAQGQLKEKCVLIWWMCVCVCADFEILGFPSNQFGGQEPGSNEQIKEFACTRFKAEFPLFDKV